MLSLVEEFDCPTFYYYIKKLKTNICLQDKFIHVVSHFQTQ
jgi:hypothetical protein